MTLQEAENILKSYTQDLNSGKQLPGTPSDAVGTAKHVLQQAGKSVEQIYESGRQILKIDGKVIV